jgi:2-polyprenyl-3-methyl-5-hydroxy-6-metoxy-1,4-benzoquinol methylase
MGRAVSRRERTTLLAKEEKMDSQIGWIDLIQERVIYGWAFDASRSTPPVIEFCLDDSVIGTAVAEESRADLAEAKIGTGNHAFRFRFPEALTIDPQAELIARFQDTKKPLEQRGKRIAQLSTDGGPRSTTDTQADWELIARHDALWAVLSAKKYSKSHLTPQAREEFFRTGVDLVDNILKRAESLFGPIVRGTAIDFGCGVGRLTIPLARQFTEVLGLDVSETMLNQARENCRGVGITNASFLQSPGALSEIAANHSIDFLISYITFQHIPERIGYDIFGQLTTWMRPKAIGSVHFVTNNFAGLEGERSQFVHTVALDDGGVVGMQMNSYELNTVVRILYECGVAEFHADFERHGQHLGCIIYFRKK